MNRIRRETGEVLGHYADGMTFTWPNGRAPTGLIIIEHSNDDGETWQELARGEYQSSVERVFTQRFVPQ